MFSFPVALDVPAGALDEMPSQLDALRLRERGSLPGAELGREQRQQGAEGSFDAAVRRGRRQDQVPICHRRNGADQLMTLMLALVALGCRRGTVRFVHDDQIRAVEQEQVLVAIALEEVDAATCTG